MGAEKDNSYEFAPSLVAQYATDMANGVLASYADSTEYMCTEEMGENEERVVTVSRRVNHVLSNPLYLQAQTFIFKKGVLVSIRPNSNWGLNSWYEFDPEKGKVMFGDKDTDSYRWHNWKAEFSQDIQDIQAVHEVTRVSGHTDIYVTYTPDEEDTLSLDSVHLGRGHNLPPEDVAKFLPDGRNVSLEELLQSVIMPFSSHSAYNQTGFQRLTKAPGFPELSGADSGGHMKTFLKGSGDHRDEIYGFAHPLRNDPDGWLAFAVFGETNESYGRCLYISVDRDSLTVQEVDGVPTISVKTYVDGEEYELLIPERRITIDEGGGDGEGRRRYITAEELRESIKDGYYMDDVLDATIMAFHDRHYPIQNKV